jgi:hypothetical protein
MAGKMIEIIRKITRIRDSLTREIVHLKSDYEGVHMTQEAFSKVRFSLERRISELNEIIEDLKGFKP